ncbi:MAG: 3-hydroxybutyryl-CoA dehydrogenase [Bacteroidetes bacterium]|nr:MAG: 3-hydroxybutyryl-CoA dehydrogenase [Bacteroidota bacterium]
MLQPIHSICVCGAGTMGSGIAQVCAQSGFYTVLFDLNSEILSKAKTNTDKSLQTLVEKGKISVEKKQDISNRIQFTNDINFCIADIVIEAIIEKLDAKIALFNQLAEINHSETIFASNTSSLSVSEIATRVVHPTRVIGMHFFNPAPAMKLVEVVKAEQTILPVLNMVMELTRQLNKTPVICKDSPGFIVNRVARHYYLESLRIAEKGIAGFEEIDKILEATGFRMGPFKLMDLIGNDINYSVTQSLYEAFDKPVRFKPSPIQEEKVSKQELGRKTGKGYYDYSK